MLHSAKITEISSHDFAEKLPQCVKFFRNNSVNSEELSSYIPMYVCKYIVIVYVRHSVEITEFYCHSFSQIFRQIYVLLMDFTVNQLTKTKLCGSEFLVFSTLYAEVLSHTFFCQKFRESNVFTIEITK